MWLRDSVLPWTTRLLRLAACVSALACVPLLPRDGRAATPSSGSLSNATPTVTWTGGVIAGTTASEAGCTEGVTCETFTLTLQPGNYTGKRIVVALSWTVPADDYDLYVNTPSGTQLAASTSGAPGTSELATIPIDPPLVAVATVYKVHVVAFTALPGDFTAGTASLGLIPAPRTATYLAGTARFSQNVTLKAPVTVSDGEPSLRVDVRGNCYVSGIRGVPGGVDLWRFDLNPSSPTFDPGMQNATYLGQPDAFVAQDPEDPTTGGADGGGDIDIAVSFPSDALSTPVVTMISLAAANISSAVSTDKGQTFTLSPAVAVAPADDRQWSEADGPNRVYMMYRAPIPATALFCQRSDDHGLTYPVSSLVNPSGTTPGYIDVDHTNHRVYIAHIGTSVLDVASSADSGLTWKNNTVDNTTDHGNLFDVVKVGDDGTVYCVWSDQHDIYLAHSTDGGVTWSNKVRVNENSTYKTNLMPWLECGSAGRVDVVWYGTPDPVNDNAADWSVLFTQTTNATDPSPTFRQQVISDHVIHGSNISLGGLTGAANRNLIDYFQVALDPQGAATIAFTDDHNDYNGHVYVTRQLDGASLYASANGSGTVTPAFPPPLPAPDPGQPEVMDYLHDATGALLQPIPEDNPYDILSVDYGCGDTGNNPTIVCTMRVSSLAAIPPGTNWRMNFTANAPGGVSDRGDQFYVMATTDTGNTTPTAQFVYGTATRTSSGAIAYTQRGGADFGMMDQANNRITIEIALSKLNPWITHGPPIGPGSVLWGLRGSTSTTRVCTPSGLPVTECAGAFRDQTRGGSSFTFPGCGPVPTMLSQFTAEDAAEGIRVTWGFGATAAVRSSSIERADSDQGPWSALDAAVETRNGTSTVLDRTAAAGRTTWYHLLATDTDGRLHTFGPVSAMHGVDASGPIVSFVRGPSPNPAPGRCAITFRVGRPGFVDLSVLDPSGRRVRTIQSGDLAPGEYAREWDGRTDHFSNAPSGMYFVVLHSADGRLTRRMTLVR